MSEQILLKLPVRVGVKKIYDNDGDYTFYYVAMVEGCREMAAVGMDKSMAIDMLKALVDSKMNVMSDALCNETQALVDRNMEFLLDTCQDGPIDATCIQTNIKIDSRFLSLTDTDIRTVARNICCRERKRLGDARTCDPDDFQLDRRLGCVVVTLPDEDIMYGDTFKLWFYGSSVDDPARDTSYDFDEMLTRENPEDSPRDSRQSIPDDPDKLLDSLMDMLTTAIRQVSVSGKDYYRKSLYQALDNLVAAREVEEANRGMGQPESRSSMAGPDSPEKSAARRKPYPSRHIKVKDSSLSKDDDCARDENEFSAETPKDPVQ
jgi:hypothetical protein